MKTKFFVTALLLSLSAIIAYNIYNKIQNAKRPPRPNEFAVGVQTLKNEAVDVAYEFNGILEGDPQVKVYSDIGGKFMRNAVSEGSYVGKNDVIAYIDRDLIGQDFQPAIVKSPITGMVKKLYFLDHGAAVTTALPIAEIANTKSVKVVISVGQEYLTKLRRGLPVKIYPTFDRSVSIQSTISSVTPFVDSDTLTGTFEVKTPNSRNFKIGSSVAVSVVTGTIRAFMVPQGAVNFGINEIYVFVNNGGVARKVPVTQGYIAGDRVEIKGSLIEGQEVVTEGAFKLSEGSKLRVVGDNPAAQDGENGKNGRSGKRGANGNQEIGNGAKSDNASGGDANGGKNRKGTRESK
jgi:multidrug efflux pump subunit AcrA (membrane-fusion protein)